MFKNGYRSFPKPIYKTYKQELSIGMKDLRVIPKDVPIRLNLVFNIKEGVKEEKWVVKIKSTNNTSKLFDSLEEAEEYHDPTKHYIEHRPLVIRYGSVPDVDNAMKPIVDYIEELGIIDNDRNVIETNIINTFNNDRESIEITLEELKPYVNESKVVEFKSK